MDQFFPFSLLFCQVSDAQLNFIRSTLQKEGQSASIFFTRLVPSYFIEVKNPQAKLPLSIVNTMAVLCVSGIGFPDAFVQAISKVFPPHDLTTICFQYLVVFMKIFFGDLLKKLWNFINFA